MSANHCLKIVSHCRVEQNRELESITLEFSVHFQDNSLCYDDNKERVRNKRQIVLYKLITFMNKEQGMSYRRISAWFNKSGIKTHHGKSWSETGSHAHMIVKRMHESELRLAQSRYKTKSEIRDFRINDGNLEKYD